MKPRKIIYEVFPDEIKGESSMAHVLDNTVAYVTRGEQIHLVYMFSHTISRQ